MRGCARGGFVLALSAALLSIPASSPAQAPTTVLPAGTRVERLDNGLLVVVVPLDTEGLVAVQTWMDVGSRDETEPGTTGYAHFFEHLMFHGSKALPGDARERKLLSLGVDENAWTSEDHTVYVSLAPARNLGELLEVEADRFKDLHLVPEEVRREAGAVQGEHRKGQADPDEAAWNAMLAAAFRAHTYGHPVIGLDEDVEAMPEGFGPVSAFFGRFYRPERATLVIAGDVDPAEALTTVKRSHGDWRPAAGSSPSPLPEEPPQEGLRRVQVPWTAGPVSPRLFAGWKVPAMSPGSKESAALSLISELLGSEVAPLHRRLIEEEELARDLWVMDPDHRSPGLLVAAITLREDADPSRIEAILLEEVAALARGGPELEQQVQAARARARRALLLGLDSPSAWAHAIGDFTAFRGDPRDLERHLEALSSVTAADVQAAARSWLVDRNLTISTLAAPAVLERLPPPTPAEGAP